jgi:carbon-monoxide dehydrogenase medium subunit
MKAAPFAYARPDSLDGALDLMARHQDEARALAGGQSLLPLLAMRLARPAVVVDLNRVAELARVERTAGRVAIGACMRLSAIERESGLGSAMPLLREVVAHVGHFQIRNRSTFGGCIAHADPAAEVPALAVLLDATVRLRSMRGERSLPATSFLLGAYTIAAEPDELVVAVDMPLPAGAGWSFAEVARREGDFALVGAAAVAPHDGPPRAVVFGAGPVARRLPAAEAAAAANDDVESAARTEIEAASDIHASAGYRRTVGARLVARVLREAAERREVR